MWGKMTYSSISMPHDFVAVDRDVQRWMETTRAHFYNGTVIPKNYFVGSKPEVTILIEANRLV